MEKFGQDEQKQVAENLPAASEPDRVPLSSKAKWTISLAIWWCNFLYGLCLNFLASSLLEFSYNFGTSVATVSKALDRKSVV